MSNTYSELKCIANNYMEGDYMEIRVLRYFIKVVQEQNISRAAQLLHVSQPTISRQLKELEEELGVVLFKRGSRSIELTESGDYLAEQARQIISLADKTRDNIRQPTDITGSITIGSGESQTMMTIAKAIKRLGDQYPHIKFNLVSTNADDVWKRLKTGLFDFGMVMEPTEKRHYDFMTLPGEARWGLLMRQDAPLAGKSEVTPSDFKGAKLIVSHQKGVSDLLKDWLGSSQVEYQIVATYNLLYNASLLVAAGVGYALCLDGIINTQGTNLKFVPLMPLNTAKTNLVWPHGVSMSGAAKAFLAEVTKTLS